MKVFTIFLIFSIFTIFNFNQPYFTYMCFLTVIEGTIGSLIYIRILSLYNENKNNRKISVVKGILFSIAGIVFLIMAWGFSSVATSCDCVNTAYVYHNRFTETCFIASPTDEEWCCSTKKVPIVPWYGEKGCEDKTRREYLESTYPVGGIILPTPYFPI